MLGPCAILAVTLLTAPRFVNVTDAVGLGPEVIPETVPLLCFADLNGDGWPDVVIDRHRVVLNVPYSASPIGRRLVEVDQAKTGLVEPAGSSLIAFADLDNDGRADAIVSESIDFKNEKWSDHGRRTGWQRGRGDGTFEPRRVLPTPPRTTAAIAVGDVNLDGRLDLYLGNWYVLYGQSAGWPNDLLLSGGPESWTRQPLPEDDHISGDDRDLGGRPTFGTIITHDLLGPRAGVTLLELNYGRRWNRAWFNADDGQWVDVAPRCHLDGDEIRHGRYPAWLKERARTDPRFDRKDEKPWRSNGNTFDGAVGDIDNDGRLDLFLSEIAHGWAGDSSDRTRVLFAQPAPGGLMEFNTNPAFNVDRIPPEPQANHDGTPAQHNWNMGDLYCNLADLDHDGRLDLIIASGDYPDNQRLRIYLQQPDGGVRDATAELGLDHDGCAQISLADVDGDGDLDILAGQTFNRYRAEQISSRSPRVRLFINEATGGRGSLELKLHGDGTTCSRDALGAVVKARAGSKTMMRELIGIGGRAGRQDEFIVHFGLGDADHVDALDVTWPDAARTTQRFENVSAGRYHLMLGAQLQPDEPSAPARAGTTDDPWSRQGYAGLTLRDIAGDPPFTIVSWIFPGPLDGEGLESPTLCRPDLIVAVNGRAVNAESFKQMHQQGSPGDRFVIEYRRAKKRGSGIPTAIDHEEAIERVEITLDSRERWSGTIGRAALLPPRATTSDAAPSSALLNPQDSRNVLGAAIDEHHLREPIDRLVGVFNQWLKKDTDYHGLSRFRAGFENPFSLPEAAAAIADPARTIASDPIEVAVEMIATNLDLPASDLAFDPEHQCPHPAAAMMEHLVQINTQMRTSLGDAWGDEAFARRCLALLRVPRDTFYLTGPKTAQHLAVIRRSMDLDFAALHRALINMQYLALIEPHDYSRHRPMELPPELAGAVEGPIISALPVHDVGWVIVGSMQANRYDMSRIAGVIEPGGNDEYWAGGLMLGCHAILDLAGDDVYRATDDQGPGSALLGLSFIDDRAGNDRYEGRLLSAGAAMFGVSILLDRAGNDTYMGGEWSLGAAAYGAGLIIDLGDGADTYTGEFLCQGVGGPRGFGAIVDQAGRDLYRANGPAPSAYGTPAVYKSYSQGIGFGYRHYAAGGIGLISDLAGDDRYEAGEFAQGGAYYYGLGILHDAGGRDLYYGNRYGQGFGVHQALGALIDDAGDDTYWSMTAASQGAGWDIGAGLLLDRAGNDSYQCDGLGQGAASMQAIGMLIDLGGADRYSAARGAVQGQSGGNTYHFGQTGAWSLSLLLDMGGAADWYSSGRMNNAATATGSPNDASSADSPLHGLCIDR